jgi:class 3 adenylate cyclase
MLEVRMAVYTGAVEWLVEGGQDRATRQCLRLLAIGHGRQILLSATTADVVRSHHPLGASVQTLGSHRLRDFAPREEVFQLLHPALPAEFRPLNSRWRDRWRRYARLGRAKT